MDWRNGRRRPLERRISIEFPSFPLNVRAESYISRAQFSQGRKRGRKEGTTGDELGALRSMNYAKSNYISCYTSGKVPLYISREEEEGESRRKNIIINAGKEENCRRIDRISPG